jgi:hypothetical protein
MESTMNSSFSLSGRIAAAGAAVIALALMLTGTAGADGHRERRHEVGEPYRAQHWIYDDRYHHGHYYPSIGYSVAVLPPGYLTLNFSSRRFYYQGGVWFAPATGGFAVVRPPVGVIVPVLPPAYTTVWIAGVPYYYANDIYYRPAPSGYAVAAPPEATTYTEAPAGSPAPQAPQTPPVPSAPPAASAAPQAGNGLWYYCDSSRAYYPYVSECKEAWRPVAAVPPQAR